MTANHPMVSVVIPTRDRLDKLTNVLLDLDLQTWPLDRFKVHVVDDATLESPGPSLAQLPLRYPCELIRVAKGGPAGARNHALQRADGDYLLFLDDRVRAFPELIEAHVEAHLQHKDQPVSVLGAFAFSEGIRRDVFCRVLEDRGLILNTRQLAPGSYHHFRTFHTGNLSLPRAAAQLVGGFDDIFNDLGCEDLDFGLRLERELAMRVFYTDRARCLHDHHPSVEEWRQQTLAGGRDNFRLYQKHHMIELSGYEDAGSLSGTKVQDAWKAHRDQQPAMEQVQAMLELVVMQQATDEPVSGRVSLGAQQSFELPRETERMVIACAELLTSYDRRGGLLEEALEELGLESGQKRELMN